MRCRSIVVCAALLALAAAAHAAPPASVSMTVTSDWGSGFQAQVTLQNTGSTALENWTLSFDFDRNITSLWEADLVSHTGNRYVLAAKAWNRRLEPGASVNLGFVASPGGNVPTPVFTVGTGGAAGATPTAVPTATATPLRTPTPTPTPTRTPTPVPTQAATATPTRTPTAVPPATPTPLRTPTAGPTATATVAPTHTPTAASSPTPTSGTLRVTFSRPSSWNGGYNGQVDVTNTGTAAVDGWQLRFTLGDTITAVWNAVQESRTGSVYVVKNESWNGRIAPGSTVSVGFTASSTGAFGTPSNGTLNGQPFTFEIVATPTPTPGGPGVPGAGQVSLAGVADPDTQFTVPLGATSVPLSMAGVTNPQFEVASNNPAVARVSVAGGSLQVDARTSGRAGLRIKETTTNTTRHIGVRVRDAAGALPGLPAHVAVGSVSEDSDPDLTMWRSFGTGDRNTRVDLRYIYLNNGPIDGWWNWQGGNGARCRNYIRESRKLGIIPCFVYYNIPDAGESYYTDLQHMQDPQYMTAYYQDLSRTLDLINTESPDDTVMMVLEPDFIGYMMQLSGRQPGELEAAVQAAYASGVLKAGVDPAFPNTLTGLVQSVNYLISRRSPQVVFGWQFNLWASLRDGSGIPATGLMKITDSLGIAAGRQRILAEANLIADYYKAAGVLSHGAHFVSIDKYGLDGGFNGAWRDPAGSTWLWNAIHWNNYLLFTRGLHERCGVPVVLWQIPVGRVNRSLAANPFDPSGTFADLPNTYQQYEDSAPTYFYGDRFTTTDPARLSYFGAADPDYPGSVAVSGNTITWSSHMGAAADAGVMAVLFGDGVGESTRGRGNPPPDGWWWMVATQRYLQSPAPRR